MPEAWETPNPNAPKLTEKDMWEAASFLGVEPALLWAVTDVESTGRGFLDDGHPKILFEGHIFFDQLRRIGLDASRIAEAHPNVCYPIWDRTKYRGGVAEYIRLEEAREIADAVALQSASWGLFQLMGFNHAEAGFPDVYQFVMAHYQSERQHLLAIAKWLRVTGLYHILREKNFTAFAKLYNGPSYKVNNYDLRLESAYERRKKEQTR